MSPAIIADASALVALWSPSDRYHEWAKGCFTKYSPPIFTSEAVMTEAAWLLRHFPMRHAALLCAFSRLLSFVFCHALRIGYSSFA